MNAPLQIAFHNLPHSQVIESAIEEAAARLEAYHDRITSCHVVVDQPHRHHKEGNLFQVRVDLKMPGSELVVKREISGSLTRGDLLTVIQDAFDEMQRRIEESVNRRRGFVKTHEDPAPPASSGCSPRQATAFSKQAMAVRFFSTRTAFWTEDSNTLASAPRSASSRSSVRKERRPAQSEW